MSNQQVISLNNIGASHMSQGKFPEAIKLLGKAISLAQELLIKQPAALEDVCSRSPTGEAWLKPTQNVQRMEYNGCYVYKEPILIPEKDTLSGHASCILVTHAVVFNLALAHQLFAFNTAQKQEQPGRANTAVLLGKAVRLYQQSLRLFLKTGRGEPSTVFTVVYLVNLGACHRALGQHDKAERIFGAVVNMFLFQSLNTSEENVRSFFDNVVSHLLLLPATAAAAA